MNVKPHFQSIQKIFTLCFIIFVVYTSKSQAIQRDTIFAKNILHKADSLNISKNFKTSDSLALEAAFIFKKKKKWSLWFEAYNIIFYNGLYSGDFDTCIQLIQKGKPELPKSERYLLGRIQFILGYCYNRKGAIFKAQSYYQDCLQYFESPKDAALINQVYGNISQIYTQEGDYKKAIIYLKYAIANGKTINDTLTIWKNTKALGDAYSFLGEFKKARKTYKKAQQLIDYKDGTFECYEAEILYELKEYDKALAATQKALQIARNCKKDATKNQYYCVANFNTMSVLLGDIYLDIGEIKKALTQYQKSLLLIKETGNLRELSKVYIDIGDTYKVLKEYDKALENYQKALQTFIPEFTENDPKLNPSKELLTLEIWLMEIFKSKGDCYLGKYEQLTDEDWLLKANENYEFAVEMSEMKRLKFSETSSKLKLGSHTNKFYEELIKAKLTIYKRTKDTKYQHEAFQIAQRANAFVLRELLNEQNALKAANIPADTIQLFQMYQKDIATLEKQLGNSTTNDSLQHKLVSKKEAFQKLKNTIATNYSKFSKLRNDLDGILVSEVQDKLKANSLFLKYFLGKNTLYIFSITKDDFFIFQTQLPDNFQQEIAKYRQSLSDIAFINKDLKTAEKQYLQTAKNLYNLLLFDVIERTKRKIAIQQLTIIPDGVLHTIPFQTLLTKQSDSWTNLDHIVIKKYAINYQYFSKMLLNNNAISKRRNSFTAFGLELDQTTLSHLQTIATDSIQNKMINNALRNQELSKLTFSDDEALQLANLMQGKSWVNSAATKTNFLKNATNATSIHLATHSLINTENPNNSSLIFTKTADSDNNLLQLDEIYHHNFNSDMITLSACNTGFGRYQKGEGLQSLARAFNFSNIPSVTATLWSIPDASSAKIMELYYSNLKKGLSKSIALQKAQLEYLENDNISSPASRLPFYWAAWTHIGNDNAISFKSQNNYTFFVIIALLCLVFIGFIMIKKITFLKN